MKDNISDGDIKKIIEALLKSEYERPALEIESYTCCILLGTLKKKNKNAISHLEKHVAGKISSKFRLSVRTPDIPVQIESPAFVTEKLDRNYISFEEICTIHKFFLTACQSRVSRGDVQGGFDIAQVRFKIFNF